MLRPARICICIWMALAIAVPLCQAWQNPEIRIIPRTASMDGASFTIENKAPSTSITGLSITGAQIIYCLPIPTNSSCYLYGTWNGSLPVTYAISMTWSGTYNGIFNQYIEVDLGSTTVVTLQPNGVVNVNHAPPQPSIDGPRTATADIGASYTISVGADPDGDNLTLISSAGTWNCPSTGCSHTGSQYGEFLHDNFTVTARAEDDRGAISPTVTMLVTLNYGGVAGFPVEFVLAVVCAVAPALVIRIRRKSQVL